MKTSNTIIFILFLIVFFVIQISCKNSKNDNKDDELRNPIPTESVKFDYNNYKINTEKDTVLIHSSGSEIFIPKHMFTDQEQKIIEGEVEIKYREFHNAFDVYLAGINTKIENDVNDISLETSGLIELYAIYNGKKALLNPEKKIILKLTAFDDQKNLSIHYSDTLNKKWIYIGRDSLSIFNFEEEISNLSEIPPEPVIAGSYAFSIGDSIEGFPELNIYKNIMFEPIIKKKCGFTGTETSVEYIKEGVYKVIFTFERFGIKNEQSCDCYLAFKKGRDHNRALKVYNKEFGDKLEDLEIKKVQLEDQRKRYNNLRLKYNGLGLLSLFHSSETNMINKDNRIIRHLVIDSLGVFIIGNEVQYPQNIKLSADFNDNEGNNISLTHIAVAERGTKTIFRYTDTISYNPGKRNILWGFTKDKKIAYFKEGQFDRINQKEGDYIFTVRILDKENPSYEEICRTLF